MERAKKREVQRFAHAVDDYRKKRLNDRPTRQKSGWLPCLISGIILAVIAVGGCVGIASMCATSPEEQRKSDEACLESVDCVAAKITWMAEAEGKCVPWIEDQSPYAFRWTDGFMEGKFDRFILMPPDHASVKYTGRALEFQNIFGAWQRKRYTCTYDPINNLALEASVF